MCRRRSAAPGTHRYAGPFYAPSGSAATVAAAARSPFGPRRGPGLPGAGPARRLPPSGAPLRVAQPAFFLARPSALKGVACGQPCRSGRPRSRGSPRALQKVRSAALLPLRGLSLRRFAPSLGGRVPRPRKERLRAQLPARRCNRPYRGKQGQVCRFPAKPETLAFLSGPVQRKNRQQTVSKERSLSDFPAAVALNYRVTLTKYAVLYHRFLTAMHTKRNILYNSGEENKPLLGLKSPFCVSCGKPPL